MMDRLYQKYLLIKQKSLYGVLILFLIIICFVLFYFLAELIKPFILAVFLSYFLNPFVTKLEEKGIPTTLAIIIPLLSILILLTLISYFFIVSLNNFFLDEKRIGLYIGKFEQLYELVKDKAIEFGVLKKNQTFGIDQIKIIISEGKKYILGILTSTTSFLSSFLLFVFYLFLLLPGIRNFKIKINRAFPSKKAFKINQVNEKVLLQIQRYITTKSLLSFVTGVLVYIICLIFGVDLALVWGVLAFLLNYIPNIGSIIALAFPIILSILQFYNPVKAEVDLLRVVGLSVGIVSVQFVIGNIIEPRLLARSLSISSLVVFLSLVVWGWLWGIAGVVLSVPIMVAISIICQNIPSLRPIAIFLQSSFPVREDIEKLSLIYHVAYSDSKLAQVENDFIIGELNKEIYNSLSIKKVWKDIQKKPLTIEEIFLDKEVNTKVELYFLACHVAVIDEELSDEEKDCLSYIQTASQLSSYVASLIHEYFNKKYKTDFQFKIADHLKESDFQRAYCHKYLGKIYIDNNFHEDSKRHLEKAMEYYIRFEEDREAIECANLLNTIK